MKKSRDAFRTISEVAEWLDIPTHVLRFWESRFSQIKPVKRAGGRRYYRPSDMALIGGVKVLLHDEGMTIRGVQKLLREKGVKHVSSFSPSLEDAEEDDAVEVVEHSTPSEAAPVFASRAARQTHAASPAASPAPEPVAAIEDDQPDMFPETMPGATAPVEVETGEEKLVETSGENIPDDAAAEVPAEAAVPAIPDTPGVPATDPDDDDASIPGEAGHAARLALANPAILAAHREAILAARERLQSLRARGAE